MYPLSYNINGLRNLGVFEAIEVVAAAGYEGIELALHADHIHPDTVTPVQLETIRRTLDRHHLPAVCLATGADDLLGPERFEPSLIAPDAAGRQRRIALIRQALGIARELGIAIVNFSSGILRPGEDRALAWERLVLGIRDCLAGETNAPLLAIEPEPNFLIGTTRDAIALIEEVNDPRLVMNLDIGHVYCSEDDFLDAIKRAAPYARHAHIEDIRNRVHCHEIPGEGDIPFDAVFHALSEGGYAGYLSVELYNKTQDWQGALQRSRAFLNGRMQQCSTKATA